MAGIPSLLPFSHLIMLGRTDDSSGLFGGKATLTRAEG